MEDGWEIVVETGGEQRVLALAGAQLSIGRADDADIRIVSPVISALHAELVLEGGGYRFRQLGRNATLLRGDTADGRLLAEGDLLEVAPDSEHKALLRVQRSRETAATIVRAPLLAKELIVGRDPAADILLANPLVSRRHAMLTREGGQPEIVDLHSSNGTFVNGERVHRHALEAGDTVRVGPYRLVFNGATLEVRDSGISVALAANNLTQRAGDLTILNDVSFACLPGEITVIAGTSGAGKTTLMDALTGLRPAAGGSVRLNGASLYSNFASLRALIGYVPQASILHQELPLEHALRYAARLRLPPDTEESEIDMRVQASMHPLDLGERAGVQIRHLSGGQQKRASIAMELLTEPSVFFLDEPTSGLDPGLSVRLMRLLRNLANVGKTVVLVSHDPASFEFCDQLIFLAGGGHLAYAGAPREALAHFNVDSYAEMYDRVESQATPSSWRERFAASVHAVETHNRIERAGGATDGSGSGARSVSVPPLPLRHQCEQLTRRYAEVLLRDTRNLITLVGQAPMIGLLLALLAKPHALTAFVAERDTQLQSARVSDATKVLLLLGVTAVWLGTINASREIVKEAAIWRRERLAGVGVVPYLASKVGLLALLAAAQNLLFLFVVTMRVHLPAHGVILAPALEFYVTLVLASVASVAGGLALSAASSSEERAITLVPLALIPQIMFAGVIFKLNAFTTFVSWFCVTRWAVKGLGATAHVPGYTSSSGSLLGIWLVLALMTVAFLYAASWLIERRNGEPKERGVLWNS